MHDTHFLCYKVYLRVAQAYSRHIPHFRSPYSHALQELKDHVLDGTARPVVMQWFNEDY